MLKPGVLYKTQKQEPGCMLPIYYMAALGNPPSAVTAAVNHAIFSLSLFLDAIHPASLWLSSRATCCLRCAVGLAVLFVSCLLPSRSTSLIRAQLSTKECLVQ